MKWNTFSKVKAKKGTKVLIVRARFNQQVTGGLLDGAKKALLDAGVTEKNCKIIEVPGSFDIPYGVVAGIKKNKPHAVIALGAIIKGETKHDEYIAHATFKTLQDVELLHKLPVTCGIITTNDLAQAQARSAQDERNVGWQSANAAIELLTF